MVIILIYLLQKKRTIATKFKSKESEISMDKRKRCCPEAIKGRYIYLPCFLGIYLPNHSLQILSKQHANA